MFNAVPVPANSGHTHQHRRLEAALNEVAMVESSEIPGSLASLKAGSAIRDEHLEFLLGCIARTASGGLVPVVHRSG
jgi:hypothetical protein